MSFFILYSLIFQPQIPLKPSPEFEIKAQYELKKKPQEENSRIVFERSEEKRSNSSDFLPYLTLTLKVKKWGDGVSHLRVVNDQNITILRKKASDDGEYTFALGFVDDIKDRVTTGKFFIEFLKDKKAIEHITIVIEEDGTFLVNNEKRGKF